MWKRRPWPPPKVARNSAEEINSSQNVKRMHWTVSLASLKVTSERRIDEPIQAQISSLLFNEICLFAWPWSCMNHLECWKELILPRQRQHFGPPYGTIIMPPAVQSFLMFLMIWLLPSLPTKRVACTWDLRPFHVFVGSWVWLWTTNRWQAASMPMSWLYFRGLTVCDSDLRCVSDSECCCWKGRGP